MTEFGQMPLLSGYYRCDDCGRDVERTFKTRRFHICVACWREIVPDLPATPEQVEAYWNWYWEMEKRHPLSIQSGSGRRTGKQPDYETDAFWPYCACGRERPEYAHARIRSLFGAPRAAFCEVCDAKQMVESVAGMTGKLHPDWDDEDWLDLLWKSHRRSFEIGVLPNYWFELKTRRLKVLG